MPSPIYAWGIIRRVDFLGVVQKAPFLGNTDTRFPHHTKGDFVVKTIKPEGVVAPSHRLILVG